MTIRKIVCLLCAILLTLTCVSCADADQTDQTTVSPSASTTTVADSNHVTEIKPDETAHAFALAASDNGTYTYRCADCGEEAVFTVSCTEGTANAAQVSGNTLTFTGLDADSVYTLSGLFYGNLVIDAGDDYQFTLELQGFTLYSDTECPIAAISGDKVEISAKKETENYLYDTRTEIAEDAVQSSVYAVCDLSLKGKGSLYITSTAHNGIHTKDDLTVKNLTLQVDCMDNALKGNDSVTIESGNLTLIARKGDGIKTTNSDVSSKGKQRGIVRITGGNVLIYASRDGIDAAYSVQIDESAAEVTVQIFTDSYSKFSQESAASVQSAQSGASILTASAETGSILATGFGGFGGGGRPGGGGFPGGNPGGNPGGMGGGGNPNKGSYSTKGIKAAQSIEIAGGTVTICSYDDCLHANSGVSLENGETSVGSLLLSGGTLTLSSQDDAVHADGTARITGGTIAIVASYEGIEGAVVEIAGGNLSVIASDDGLNGTGTAKESIVISGGSLYVLAGGDGVDSNSTTSYDGILFSGGSSVIFSYGQADSAIDTERGYAYTGGFVVAVGLAGGMSGESTNCSPALSKIGTSKTLSLQKGATLTVSGVLSVEVPVSMNALVVCLGSTSATISAA